MTSEELDSIKLKIVQIPKNKNDAYEEHLKNAQQLIEVTRAKLAEMRSFLPLPKDVTCRKEKYRLLRRVTYQISYNGEHIGEVIELDGAGACIIPTMSPVVIYSLKTAIWLLLDYNGLADQLEKEALKLFHENIFDADKAAYWSIAEKGERDAE